MKINRKILSFFFVLVIVICDQAIHLIISIGLIILFADNEKIGEKIISDGELPHKDPKKMVVTPNPTNTLVTQAAVTEPLSSGNSIIIYSNKIYFVQLILIISSSIRTTYSCGSRTARVTIQRNTQERNE